MSFGQSATMRAAPAVRLRRVLLAPFGEYTRYRMTSHLVHVLMVMGALDTIAMTLELPPRLTRILAQNPDATGIWAIVFIVWYIIIRSADLMVMLLPFACFLGVFWSEINHTWTRERLMIWNCGRSPAQCLAPAVLFGALFGVFQFAMDIYVRPVAINYQIDHRLGDVGDAYVRKKTDPTWLALGNDLVHARIDYGPPELTDVTLFRLDVGGQIRSVVNARVAVPTHELGVWMLRDGNRWDAELGTQPGAPDFGRRKQPPSPEGKQTQFAEQTIDLKIDPLWLAHKGMHAQHLLQSVAVALASAPPGFHQTSEYSTWIHLRYARGFFAFGMALLAATMSMLLLPYTTRTQAFVVTALTGYAVNVAYRTMGVIGEFNYVSPPLIIWSGPAVLFLASVAIVIFLERDRLGLRRPAHVSA